VYFEYICWTFAGSFTNTLSVSHGTQLGTCTPDTGLTAWRGKTKSGNCGRQRGRWMRQYAALRGFTVTYFVGCVAPPAIYLLSPICLRLHFRKQCPRPHALVIIGRITCGVVLRLWLRQQCSKVSTDEFTSKSAWTILSAIYSSIAMYLWSTLRCGHEPCFWILYIYISQQQQRRRQRMEDRERETTTVSKLRTPKGSRGPWVCILTTSVSFFYCFAERLWCPHCPVKHKSRVCPAAIDNIKVAVIAASLVWHFPWTSSPWTFPHPVFAIPGRSPFFLYCCMKIERR